MKGRVGVTTLLLAAYLNIPISGHFCVALVYHPLRGTRSLCTLSTIQQQYYRNAHQLTKTGQVHYLKNNNDQDINNDTVEYGNSEDFIRSEEEEYNNMMEQVRLNSPDSWTITRTLLGVNIFTYLLLSLIVFFLSMNLILGPGWLGQKLGIDGTGSFEEVSESLPLSIILSKPQYFIF